MVRRIFFLTMDGYGPYQISKLLSEAKVEIPAVHLARFHEGVNRSKPVKGPYGWGSSTIVNILKKRAGELERLICKIYEDNALGKLPDARYDALDAQYAKENLLQLCGPVYPASLAAGFPDPGGTGRTEGP